MKQSLLTIITLLCFVLSAYSQTDRHLVWVSSRDSWGHDYLTVICDNKINSYFPNYLMLDAKYMGWTEPYSFSRKVFYKADTTMDYHNAITYGDIRNRDVVTSINGLSTKGMDEDTFYEILDELDEVELSVLRREGTKIMPLQVKVGWDKTNNSIEKQIVHGDVQLGPIMYNGEESVYWQTTLFSTYPINRYLIKNWFYPRSNYYERSIFLKEICPYANDDDIRLSNIDEMVTYYDKDYDWFNIVTYDYILGDENPLLEKDLITSFIKGVNTKFSEGINIKFKRDTENPDILIRVATNSSQATNTVYIPEQDHIITTGATSNARYDFKGRFKGFNTTAKQEVVTTGGYNVDVTNADLFFEFSILDVKRMMNPSQREAPVVWQARWEQHYSRAVNFNLLYRIGIYTIAGIFCPFPHSFVKTLHCITKSNTIQFDAKKKRVTYIDPKSIWYTSAEWDSSIDYYVEIPGLRTGDIIKSMKWYNGITKDYRVIKKGEEIEKKLLEDVNDVSVNRKVDDRIIVDIKRGNEKVCIRFDNLKPDPPVSYARKDRTLFGIEVIAGK